MNAALPRPRSYRTELMDAEVSDYGAQVTRWAPTGAESALWRASWAQFRAGDAIRGGVPICFPWFGPGRGGDRRPAHGFARTTVWRLVSETASQGVITLDYELTESDATAPGFPGPYRAAYRLVLGQTLELTLTVTNPGHAPLKIEEALHTYLAVGDVREVWLDGLDGAEYADKVRGRVGRQVGPVRFTEETDRVYRSQAPIRLVDPVLDRNLVIEMAGAANVVVWTPWSDLASSIPDIGEQAWSCFVCVEAANALSDFVTVAPGESHGLGYRLEVSSYEP